MGLIGVGVILAIIGFFPGGISWFWGVLIAVVSGITYMVNANNEKKVQERLNEEKGMFKRDSEDKKE